MVHITCLFEFLWRRERLNSAKRKWLAGSLRVALFFIETEKMTRERCHSRTVSGLFIFFALLGLSRDVQAQTIVVGRASYPLTYYEDSNGGSAEDAILADVVDEYDTKSYKIKLLSRTKSTYTDSRGARFSCKERPTFTRCSATFPVDGTDCVTKYTNVFRVNFSRRQVLAVFEELFACEDGSYILSQHSGIMKFSVRR